MKKINVLIFPSSGENSYEIYDSLKYNINLNVYGATTKHDYCERLYPNNRLIIGEFNINAKEFINNFNKLLNKLNIDIVIPTHDTVSYFLAENRHCFSSKILTPCVETARICRNKRLIFDLFRQEDFCPKFYLAFNEDIKLFPLFLKPNMGQGAQGVKKVESIDEFRRFMLDHDDYVACEYLPGEEYTVDCFTNLNGDLLFVGQRTRENVSGGISIRSRSLEVTEDLMKIAQIINKKLDFRGGGGWFFQLKKDTNGKLKLLEISCRQAGTMMLFRQRGINFALLGIYSLMGNSVSIIDNNYQIMLDRRLEARYLNDIKYKKVYIDYDDTIIIDNQVVLDVIQYLYYCKNKGIEINLITRHNVNYNNSILVDLEEHAISPLLFNNIICLDFDDEKVNYICGDDSIFIDNSFKERLLIYNRLKIPVFDVDAVKSLITN